MMVLHPGKKCFPNTHIQHTSKIITNRFKRVEGIVSDAFRRVESLSKEDFLKWIESKSELLNRLYSEIALVANLQLGVRPLEPGGEMDTIKNVYAEFNPNRLKKGDEWFVLSREWWDSWVNYTGYSLSRLASSVDNSPSPSSTERERENVPPRIAIQKQLSSGKPGVIDNSRLIVPMRDGLVAVSGLNAACAYRLRADLSFGHDYVLVNRAVWTALVSWYGSREGIGAVSRYVIEDSIGRMDLELYPLVLKVYVANMAGDLPRDFKYFTWSRSVSVAQVMKDIKTRLKQESDPRFRYDGEFRLWNCFNDSDSDADCIKDYSATLESINMSSDTSILVEIKSADGSWPRDHRRGSIEIKSRAGVVGLQNLGNTCFMNSSLQSLSNTGLLKDYFTSGYYLYDINIHSTWGMQGRLAAIYGELLCEIWSTKHKTIAPRKLKAAIGVFKPQFSGYEQHDAQEFLDFLIDGLAEDLNRIRVKPFVEQPDSNNRPDAVVADLWWKGQLKREVSIIQAVFTGQFKSLTKCNSCSFESSRFEPFRLLSLPLPDQLYRFVTVELIPIASEIVRVSIRVDKKGTVADVIKGILKLEFCKSLGILSENNLVVADISVHKFISSLTDPRKTLDQIRDSEVLVAYQIKSAQELVDVSFNPMDVVKDQSIEPLKVGDRIQARWKGQGTWYNAKLLEVSADGTFIVEYDDMEVEASVQRESIQRAPVYKYVVGSPVYARFKSGKRAYAAQVIEVHDDETFTVKYNDDGTVEEKLPRTHISVRQPTPIFFVVVHRRNTTETKRYYLNPLRYQLFGVPILLRFLPEYTSGRTLYEEVFRRVSRFFSRKLPPMPGPGHIHNRVDTLSAWGFALSFTNKTGLCCKTCHWLDACKGCFLPPDAATHPRISDSDQLAIDWDKRALSEDYHESEAYKIIIHESYEQQRKDEQEPLTLHKCLADFTSDEILLGSGSSAVYCPKCKTHTDSLKKIELWRPPPVLVIQLKRFQYNEFNRRKLSAHVKFPVKDLDITRFFANNKPSPKGEVDLTFWKHLGGKLKAKPRSDSLADAMDDNWALPTEPIRPDPVYDLYSVINHVGAMGAGHYVCYAANPDNHNWYSFNDGVVTPLSENEIVTSSAYLLFYVRKDMRDKKFPTVFPIDRDRELVDVSEMLKPSFKDRVCVVQ